MQMTETYTGKLKSEWLKCLKAFYHLAQTHTKLDKLTQRLESDYDSKLQSWKVDEWLINQGIIFEPLASYSQKENGVSNFEKIFCPAQGALSGSDLVDPGRSHRLYLPKLLAVFDLRQST